MLEEILQKIVDAGFEVNFIPLSQSIRNEYIARVSYFYKKNNEVIHIQKIFTEWCFARHELEMAYAEIKEIKKFALRKEQDNNNY